MVDDLNVGVVRAIASQRPDPIGDPPYDGDREDFAQHSYAPPHDGGEEVVLLPTHPFAVVVNDR